MVDLIVVNLICICAADDDRMNVFSERVIELPLRLVSPKLCSTLLCC